MVVFGLENLVSRFVRPKWGNPEELKQADGDPIALQRLVDKANDAEKPLPPGS